MIKGRCISKLFLVFFIISPAVLTTAFFFAGCGSSESLPVLTGVFLDSAVQGLEYQYGSKVGKTDENGKFYYNSQDEIIFSLGGVEIGRSFNPKEMMTPIDLVDDPASFVTHPTVTNICRLLQSLDEDGNPENGIFITKEIRDVIQSSVTSFNFNVDSDAFKTAMTPLFNELNSSGVFNGGNAPRSLVDPIPAQNHFFSTLAEQNATPVVLINLGDGYTNGTKGGFGNVHQYTQNTSFAAYISYQLANACDLIWVNPLLEIDTDKYDEDGTRVFYRIENSEDDFNADEEYLPYFTPTNLGVDGATIQSIISDKTDLTSGTYSLLNEILLPIPENKVVSQLEAAVYVANKYKNRLKLFTLWIGAEDTLGSVTGERSDHLTEAEILAYLNDVNAGRDTIESNLTNIIDTLKEEEDAGISRYIFIGTLPSIKTVGALYGKSDIEAMATFEGANVTALSDGTLIGYKAFISNIANTLDTDNATLNAAIAETILNDADVLDPGEIALIDNNIKDINEIINNFRNENERIYVVDLERDIFNKLADEGIEIVNADGTDAYTVYKTFAKGKGFYTPDGYYPTSVGSALIANEFSKVINSIHDNTIEGDEEQIDIGIGIDLYDIVDSILPVDFYNTDTDGDGFIVTPGTMTTSFIPQYDKEQIGGWIDCNDSDAEALPYYVSEGDCN